MGSREDVDSDDDFSELYKEYTGPVRTTANKTEEITTTKKRSHAGSDEEQEERDPNAVPTDFTSREAKVWEAKSKATERNWKKRKEEELICKICGESGHFTQGCPSTLGANRKSQDFFERVPARDSHVKALFTEKVVSKIEKDTGCKIKMEEKFIIVSGKDRLILRKGVDAVHKIKEESEKKGPGSQMSRSRSPERRSPVPSRLGRTDSQRSNPSPHNASQFQHRHVRHEKTVEDRVRDDLQKLSRGSPQVRAYGNNGARGRSSLSRSPARPSFPGNSHNSYDNNGSRGRSSHSRSPAHPSFAGNLHNSYEVHSHGRETYRTDGWNVDRRGSEMIHGRKFEYNAFPQTLEELELEYKKDVMGLVRNRDKDEDEENNKHREVTVEMRENYMKKLASLRETHAKQWDEFLKRDAQRRQQEARQHISASGFSGYKQSEYPEYDHSTGNPNYPRTNFQMESRGRYPNDMENYTSSRPYDTYGDLQRPRRDDFGKAYERY